MFITNCLIASYPNNFTNIEPHASLGCSAVSHRKLAQAQLNAAEIHLEAVKCSQETWLRSVKVLQVCEGVMLSLSPLYLYVLLHLLNHPGG